MSNSKVITVVLTNGDYNDVVIASQEFYRISAVKMPRTYVKETKLKQAEMPGVYLLFCDFDDGTRGVYIGQADNIKNRLKIHMNDYDRGKENYYWSTVIFIVSEDLDTTRTRYLENKLFQEATEINSISKEYKILTKTTYHSANVKNASSLEEFYEYMKNMIALLGYGDVFKRIYVKPINNEVIIKETSIKTNNSDIRYLFCTRSGSKAVGFISSGGFTVLKGSKVGPIAASFERRGCGYYLLRKKLEGNGIIKDKEFRIDYEFTSPSAAASVVIGNEANGKVEWRSANININEFFANSSGFVHKKANPLRFSMIGLKPGDLLTFIDDSSVVVKIIDDRHVEYKGKSWSLSPLVKELCHNNKEVQDPLFFTYKGRRLTDIRKSLNK